MYRRRARRLRHVYAADPAGLHRALAELSRSSHRRTITACGFAAPPRRASADERIAPYFIDETSMVRQRFAQRVAERVSGPILRYSHREQLLRQAIQLGIGRFEANLIIAAAQYRAGRIERASPQNAAPRCRAWVLAAALQGMILLGVWWIAF